MLMEAEQSCERPKENSERSDQARLLLVTRGDERKEEGTREGSKWASKTKLKPRKNEKKKK